MRKLLITLATAAAVVLGSMGLAEACNTQSISVTQVCDARTDTTTVTFTALVGSSNDHANWFLSAPQQAVSGGGAGGVLPGDGSGVFVMTGVKPGATVRVWEQASAGEQRGNVLTAISEPAKDCKPPVKKGHLSGRFNGPCGDPFYRAIFRNGTNRPQVFRFFYTAFNGGNAVRSRTVAANSTARTVYVHVLGGTRLLIKSGGKVLRTKLAAAPGNYGVCA